MLEPWALTLRAGFRLNRSAVSADCKKLHPPNPLPLVPPTPKGQEIVIQTICGGEKELGVSEVEIPREVFLGVLTERQPGTRTIPGGERHQVLSGGFAQFLLQSLQDHTC